MSCYNLKRVTQVAIVVRDIERASAVWSELLGLEKPPIEETEDLELTHMTFKGKPSRGRRTRGICSWPPDHVWLQTEGPITVLHASLPKPDESHHKTSYPKDLGTGMRAIFTWPWVQASLFLQHKPRELLSFSEQLDGFHALTKRRAAALLGEVRWA